MNVPQSSREYANYGDTKIWPGTPERPIIDTNGYFIRPSALETPHSSKRKRKARDAENLRTFEDVLAENDAEQSRVRQQSPERISNQERQENVRRLWNTLPRGFLYTDGLQEEAPSDDRSSSQHGVFDASESSKTPMAFSDLSQQGELFMKRSLNLRGNIKDQAKRIGPETPQANPSQRYGLDADEDAFMSTPETDPSSKQNSLTANFWTGAWEWSGPRHVNSPLSQSDSTASVSEGQDRILSKNGQRADMEEDDMEYQQALCEVSEAGYMDSHPLSNPTPPYEHREHPSSNKRHLDEEKAPQSPRQRQRSNIQEDHIVEQQINSDNVPQEQKKSETSKRRSPGRRIPTRSVAKLFRAGHVSLDLEEKGMICTHSRWCLPVIPESTLAAHLARGELWQFDDDDFDVGIY